MGNKTEKREAKRKRQRSGENDRQWKQQGKNRRKRLGKKYKLPTPYLLFSIKLICSNGSCRSRLGGTSIPITMLPTHTLTGRAGEREKEGGAQV